MMNAGQVPAPPQMNVMAGSLGRIMAQFGNLETPDATPLRLDMNDEGNIIVAPNQPNNAEYITANIEARDRIFHILMQDFGPLVADYFKNISPRQEPLTMVQVFQISQLAHYISDLVDGHMPPRQGSWEPN